MSSLAQYIAVDWGTTNRRSYLIGQDGEVLDTFRDGHGILSLNTGMYPAEVAAIRSRFGQLPMIAAGMIGSASGWKEAPYVAAPAGLAELGDAAVWVSEEEVAIVPGVSVRHPRADVMRGEEVQVLGAASAGYASTTGLYCQPGTHNKWINLVEGRICDFRTAMTGELFSLLRSHGTLQAMLEGPVKDGDAFRAGLARGWRAHDLTSSLFGIRASVLLGELELADAASFASGVLIGNDVGGQTDLEERDVYLLSSGPLTELYASAIRSAGGSPVALDGHACFVAGIHHIWNILK